MIISKTDTAISEIVKFEQYYPQDFQTAKETFLDYAFSHYSKSKLSSNESYASSIFVSILYQRRICILIILLFSFEIFQIPCPSPLSILGQNYALYCQEILY
jgi:hypothetical protein